MDIYGRMKRLGVVLPKLPQKAGLYARAKRFAGGSLVYLSACGPSLDGTLYRGRLGGEFTLEEGQGLARSCMLNLLAILEGEIGSLARVVCPVKVLTMVACTEDFTRQPAVADGGTKLLLELFDEVPARSAIGVPCLPGNAPVGTEALFEIEV